MYIDYSKKTLKERIMQQELESAFWRGVVRGAIGATCFFAGLVATIYYVIQIVEAVK